MFDKLREVVTAHTKERQERADPPHEYKLPADQEPSRFRVIRTSGSPVPEAEVRFRLRDDDLVVAIIGQGEPQGFDAAIQMQRNGTCIFVVDGETLTPEQVSERALTDLFFPD